jgi:hypothetical protein
MKQQKMILDGKAFHFVMSAWLASGEKDKALRLFRDMRAPQNVHLMYVECVCGFSGL